MDTTIQSILLLAAASIGAGIIGYLTGLASLVSYPALLAVGLPPLSANTTNTVAIVGAGGGAFLQARKEVLAQGRARLVPQLSLCILGGLVGAVLLLVTGEKVFTYVVPWLVALAALALLCSPWLKKIRRKSESWISYLIALFVVSIYGGYFGAGSGVVLLAVLIVATNIKWNHAVMMKTICLATANLSAAIIFVFFSPVDWLAAGIMFAGQLIGGYIGPLLQDHIPERLSRWVISLGGFYLAWSLLP